LIIFDRTVTDKVGNQKTLYYATSNNLCLWTTWQNGETRKSHFHSVGLCYTHNAPMRCLLKEKVVICDVFDSVYTVSQKGATLIMPITLSILDRFAKFFHWCKEQ